jgi:hypothetical protein
MFRATRVIRRPNTSIPFHHDVVPKPNADYQREFFIRYVRPGKFLGLNKKMSEDLLTVEIAIDWDTKDSYVEYATDENQHIKKWLDESNLYVLDNEFLDYYSFEEIK